MLKAGCRGRFPVALAVLAAAVCFISAMNPELFYEIEIFTPDIGEAYSRGPAMKAPSPPPGNGRDASLRTGWPVNLSSPGAGFPYTPTLFDMDGDGADEIFLTGGHTFGLKGDGSFLPGWPTKEMQYMGYGTNGNKPGPSAAGLEADADCEVLWTERDWWAGSAKMWCFNGKELDGSNLPGFPQQAPGQTSNALDTLFVLGDVDGDGDLEAWGAHTLGNNFTHYRITAFDHFGNLLFTTDLDTDENVICLFFGNLDGAGGKEMFAFSELNQSLYLHVFEADGSERAGYPILIYTLPGSAYHIFGPPIAADLDGDGDLEILFGNNQSSTSYARCYQHDGTVYTGFPMQIATSSQLFYLGMGDVTGDGDPELLALENHLGGNYRAFVFDLSTGSLLPGWPYMVPDWPKGFPAVADVDNDNVQDICFVTDGGELYALTGTGQLITGYPKTMSNASISGVGVGDIDADGFFEMVAATWDGWVYAWDTPSTADPSKADWPMRGVNARNTGVFGDRPVPVSLTSSTTQLSAATGGVVDFTLFAGSTHANRNYILLGSITGTEPGTPLPGGMAVLPLSWDLFTNVTISLANSAIFPNSLGPLDAAGAAAAQFNTLGPLPPAMVGLTLYFAYGLNGPWDFASNPVGVKIAP